MLLLFKREIEYMLNVRRLNTKINSLNLINKCLLKKIIFNLNRGSLEEAIQPKSAMFALEIEHASSTG